MNNEIILKGHKDSKAHILKLSRLKENIFEITIGNWQEIEGRKDFETINRILIDTNGIIKLVEELERVIIEKPLEEEDLLITFIKNIPQFKILVKFKEDEGVYQLSAGINQLYSKYKDTREESQYRYEDGGRHIYLIHEYTLEELNGFVNSLREIMR